MTYFVPKVSKNLFLPVLACFPFYTSTWPEGWLIRKITQTVSDKNYFAWAEISWVSLAQILLKFSFVKGPCKLIKA